MARVLTLLRHDARLQRRYGIYHAYAVVVAFYVSVLVWAGHRLPDWLPGLIAYSDPAAVGFFFLGALTMLEKGEGTREALAVSPVSARDYFAGKAGTLVLLSLFAVLAIAFAGRHAAGLPLLLSATALTALCFLGLGVPIAFRFRTVTSYLIGASAWLAPLVLPAGLALLDPMPAWAILLPPASQLRLILVATGYGHAAPAEIFAMLIIAAIAAGGAVRLALRRLESELGK